MEAANREGVEVLQRGQSETVAVLDFETTGMSPALGDRPTEIAIALVRDGCIVDRYASLMNAGRRVPAEITMLTGITNEMIARAPPAAAVMDEAARFAGGYPLVAHNAAFDRRFWEAELAALGRAPASFACTRLIARRVYPQLPNHRLGSLVAQLRLPQNGRAHRALADAEMTCHLWLRLLRDIGAACGVTALDHRTMVGLQKTARRHVPEYLNRLQERTGQALPT